MRLGVLYDTITELYIFLIINSRKFIKYVMDGKVRVWSLKTSYNPCYIFYYTLQNVLSKLGLDYCNSLFRGLSGFNQHKLQSIQNTLARFVTNHRKYAHVTPILKKLHWLPVKCRCIFKTATLVYKFLHSDSPSYFEPFLSFSSCSYSTRHSHPDRQYLTVPPFYSSVFKSASSSFPFISL